MLWSSGEKRGKEDELADMVKAIIQAVDEGREGELREAGLKVTKRSDLERMRDNLDNAQIIESVLGNMSGAEEQEIMRLLEKSEATMGVVGFDESPGLDDALLAEFRAEAVQTMRNLKSSGKSLLDEDTTSTGGGGVGPGTERPLSPTTAGGDAPPSFGRSMELEVDPSELESEPEPSAAAAVESKTGAEARQSPAAPTAEALAAVEAEKGLSDEDGSRALAQQTFAQLLKASMDASEERATDAQEATRKQTIEAVSSGDFAALDVKSLLGETLGTLAETLGIDVRSELAGSDKARGDMQAIMSSSMQELATNMAELDEQSQMLFQKLGNLEEELRKETAAFEEQKSSELEGLLGRQAALQGDIDSSRDQVQASAKQLERLMADLDEKADLLT